MTANNGRFFGEKYDSFEDAFSKVDKLILIVEEKMGETSGGTTYNEKDVPNRLECSNELCENGGVYVDSLISDMIRHNDNKLNKTERCEGLEPINDGYKTCLNEFELDIEIVY